VEDAQHLAQGTEVRVTLTACEQLSVRGDRHRLRQLLLNLTDNAIKYNRPAGSVTVALRQASDSGELAISNTGPGIPPELLAKVFDRFFRGDASHGSAIEGSGLGLSIAQWIVHAHGGTIRIESEAGGLTTVTVRLKICAAS
jgi:signal transduction histidine kinase